MTLNVCRELDDHRRAYFHGIDECSGANKVNSPKRRPVNTIHRSKAKQPDAALDFNLADTH